MQASSGAIESVTIEKDTWEVSFKTIGNTVPRGLCGSGIVDIIAEMLKTGIIDTMGTMTHEAQTPRLRINRDGQPEFVVAQTPHDVVVTQKDVAAIQLAKGAIQAGIAILMEEMKIKSEDISRVYIAGAFGAYINPASARAIGIVPPVPLNIVTGVGNAASTGATMALVSSKSRKMCEEISNRVEYIELAAHPRFQPVFMESLRFPRVSSW
jgi:uncharacterized 2Fe-2S/4Fe-4S cluster protein (DUF4445 family)